MRCRARKINNYKYTIQMAIGIKYSLASQPDNSNILNYSHWAEGVMPPTGYGLNGSALENIMVTGKDPHGEYGPLWQSYNSDIENGAEGGWNSSNFAIDNTKKYRFSVWLKTNGAATHTADGRYYLGCRGYGSTSGVYYRTSGTLTTNPYFLSSSYAYKYTGDLWYLIIAYIWPAGSGTGANSSDNGIYTKDYGKITNISTINDMVWHSTTTSSGHRCYFHYATTPVVTNHFVYPRVDMVDGSEPSINDLLRGYGGYPVADAIDQGNFYIKNSNIGPTHESRYWTAINPPSGGYTLYQRKESQGPSIRIFQNDAALIDIVNQLSGNSYTLISQATDWIDSQSDFAYVAG